jgi:ketosteroid isomerase-like protein
LRQFLPGLSANLPPGLPPNRRRYRQPTFWDHDWPIICQVPAVSPCGDPTGKERQSDLIAIEAISLRECRMPKAIKAVAATKSKRADAADRKLIERALAFWSVQDVEQTLEAFSDDIVYQLYICQSALPFGGETRGKEAVRTMLFDILAQFDYVSYEPWILSVTAGVARIQTRYVMRHRASEEELAGSKRFVCTIKRGRITLIVEYHDAPLVKAFMELANWRIDQKAAAERALRARR